ncbi:MAG: GH3 auxin-responsive promoter family protein, partial [Polyangiaceae bacterium]|nr:GH3 auxin-responsive promoter family protein [Polyangiaceae bacterium]
NKELHEFPGKAPRSLRAAQLLRAWHGDMDPAFFQELWPDLAIVSAWDTSTSKRWALRLAELLPQAELHGKGLWATEGVVTLPYRGRMPLAVSSHFYEFVDLDDGSVHFAWELREGQQVRPLLTTSSGFLRYAMNDRVVVAGKLHNTPCFEFLGRIGDVDMVGEKTSPQLAQAALDQLSRTSRCKPVSLLAIAPVDHRDKPRYVALCEGPPSVEDDEARSTILEDTLRGAFHYALARDLDQLERAQVLTIPDARSLYETVGVARGMVAGNIKVEPLLLCSTAEAVAQVARRLFGPAPAILSYQADRRS